MKKEAYSVIRTPGVASAVILPESTEKEKRYVDRSKRTCRIYQRIPEDHTEEDICEYCTSPKRDRSQLMVVEESQDTVTINQAGIYNGLFHVLGGAINPLNGIGPDKLRIKELIERIEEGNFKEVIIATNPTEEGDTTAIYIKRLLEDKDISVTRLASGLPIGGDLGYADKTTLMRSLKSRIKI